MKKRIHKTLSGSLMAAAMVFTSVSAVAPMAANAEEEEKKGCAIIEADFDESPVILPWHTADSLPAAQHFKVEDGRLCVTIDNNIGPYSRFDLQTRVRGLPLVQGHEYRISCKISATDDGYIYSRIGDYSGANDFWNSLGGQEWTSLKVEKDKEYEITDTFLVTESLNYPCEWSFAYADNNGMYNIPDTGMPNGSTIYFDDLKLEDLSGDSGIEYTQNEFGMIRPKSNVRINQIGYYSKLEKIASYCTDNSEPCEFEIRDSDGKAVYTGTASKVVTDTNAGIVKDDETKSLLKNSGKYVQILDFSDFDKVGKFTIFVKDKVGVSGTSWYKKEGAFDTKADGDKLIWKNWITYKEYCMNESAEFEVSNDIYTSQHIDDALNYFYQNRSGIDIEDKYISSDESKKQDSQLKLDHEAALKEDKAYVQSDWVKFYADKYDGSKDYQIDVTGGWTDADSHCKSVINGGFAVWTLQNSFELAKAMGTAENYIDQQHIPENSNGIPDVLDEARYELEWMMKMMVTEDDPFFGKDAKDMVYHKVQDHKWVGLAYKSWDYIGYNDVTRIVKPPTYAATLNLSACAAQAARLWKDYDPEFADKCLDVAKRTYAAVKAKTNWKTNVGDYHEDLHFAPYDQAVGGDAYGDSYVQDEFYWAGCELYAATGDKEYYEDISSYKNENDKSGNDKAFSIRTYGTSNRIDGNCAFNYNSTSGLGTLTLALHSDMLEEKDSKSVKGSIVGCAEDYIAFMHNPANGMGLSVPPSTFEDPTGIRSDGYGYLSNGSVVNNALLMVYAYSLTGQASFLNGAAESMDYIYGRNGLDYSYVTGYGTDAVKNPTHQYWANQLDQDFPTAPSGVLVGGPCNPLPYYDKYMSSIGLNNNSEAYQRNYADYIIAYSVNICGVELNAPLFAVESFMHDFGADGAVVTITNAKTTAVTTTTTTTSSTASTTSTNTLSVPVKTYGDVNCDDEVSMADAVLIMQAIANPDKYGVKGSEKTHITEQGQANADCCNTGDGMTTKDALSIQKLMLKMIDKLPDKS